MGGEHDHPVANFDRAFAIGIVLNVVFVAVEGFYGWRVNSLALLADAGHNLSDVAGLVLAWGGALAVRLRPDARHTYGWKRATILAAFANALLLLMAIGALAWEALGRLLAPVPGVAAQGVTIMAVAGVGIVINTVTALLFMRGREHDLNIRGCLRAHGSRCTGVRWCAGCRRAHTMGRMGLAGSGDKPGDCLRYFVWHLGAVQAVAAPAL